MAGRDDEVALARSLKMKREAMINPLVAEIAEALLECGGAAHRNVVIERLALNRGILAASDAFRREVIQAFEVHVEGAALRGERALVWLPFGEGSYRWSLTLDAHTHLHGAVRRRAE